MKPILFNTEMVKAILDGRKSVTRRAIKNLPSDAELGWWLLDSLIQEDAKDVGKVLFKTSMIPTKKWDGIFVKPPYEIGDILYVRETWQLACELNENDEFIDETEKYYYAAGPDDVLPNFTHWLDARTGERKDYMPWRPSIHMPKKAARIFLRVADVRVERLQEIGGQGRHDEILKEGYPFNKITGSPQNDFALLWNSTISKKDPADMYKYGWKANPWVWVIEFERISREEAYAERN